MKDEVRFGRPVTDKISAIFEKVEQDRHISSYGIAEELDVDHKTVLRHLRKSGYKKKLDIWVPHDLTERNLMQRVSICDSLLKRNNSEPFLKQLLRVMKNGSLTIRMCEKDRGRSMDKPHRPWQSPV